MNEKKNCMNQMRFINRTNSGEWMSDKDMALERKRAKQNGPRYFITKRLFISNSANKMLVIWEMSKQCLFFMVNSQNITHTQRAKITSNNIHKYQTPVALFQTLIFGGNICTLSIGGQSVLEPYANRCSSWNNWEMPWKCKVQ